MSMLYVAMYTRKIHGKVNFVWPGNTTNKFGVLEIAFYMTGFCLFSQRPHISFFSHKTWETYQKLHCEHYKIFLYKKYFLDFCFSRQVQMRPVWKRHSQHQYIILTKGSTQVLNTPTSTKKQHEIQRARIPRLLYLYSS